MTRSTPLDEDAIAWSHDAGARSGVPLVVLMHGYSVGSRPLDFPDDGHLLSPRLVHAALDVTAVRCR